MRTAIMLVGLVSGLWPWSVGADEVKLLSPEEAIKQVDRKVTVEMEVKAVKNRVEKRGEIYLDSETDFRDAKNLGVVVTRIGLVRFKKEGIDDPAVHFKGKTIRVKGTVILKEDRPRIEIDDPNQIQIVKKP